jgi:hypothetical protein
MKPTTNDSTAINLTPKVALKFLRCVEFTLPDGKTYTAKLLGPADQSILDAKAVVAAFNATAARNADVLGAEGN